MDLGLSEEQELLKNFARDFLEKECPSTFVRNMMEDATSHDPAYYAKMVRAAEQAVHSTHPEMLILMSGDWYNWRVGYWLKLLLAADPTINRLPNLRYSVHPYTCQNDPYSTALPGLQAAYLVHSFDPSVPIWITELGWETAGSSSIQFPDCVISETTQADYYMRATKRALGDWGSWIETAFFYVYENDWGFGMLRSDGTLKPAWGALTGLIAAG